MIPSIKASADVLRAEVCPPRVSLERQVLAWAGALVLAGVMLGLHVHPSFHMLPAAVGAALLWSGIFESCDAGPLLSHATA